MNVLTWKSSKLNILCLFRNHPGVYVGTLIPGGPAEKEGTLRKGDQIMAVNGVDVKSASQEVVAQLLKVPHRQF